MKLQKIVDICKKSGQMYITHAEDTQWVGNGQAIYPLYDLPKLQAEELCTIYGITEDQQDKMILNEKSATEYDVSFAALDGSEEAVVVVPMEITFGGASYKILRSKTGISFVKRLYFSPFKEETQVWQKKNKCGEYFIITAGMFVVGVIFPKLGLRADIAAEIKDVAERL